MCLPYKTSVKQKTYVHYELVSLKYKFQQVWKTIAKLFST